MANYSHSLEDLVGAGQLEHIIDWTCPTPLILLEWDGETNGREFSDHSIKCVGNIRELVTTPWLRQKVPSQKDRSFSKSLSNSHLFLKNNV